MQIIVYKPMYTTCQVWFQVKFDFPLFQTYYHNPKTKENTNQPLG